MGKGNVKNIVIRCFAILLMAFSIGFGTTWNKSGYCLGDNILSEFGLKTWSNGTQGIHYAAVCALILLLIASFLFAITTEKKDRTLKYLVMGSIAIIFCANILSFII